MDHSFHIARSEETFGVGAKNIHKWIDGCFDRFRFYEFQMTGRLRDWERYDHRKIRHHREAADKCVEEFKHKYDEDLIRSIFEQHVRDDYDGHYPLPDDLEDEAVVAMHHRG